MWLNVLKKIHTALKGKRWEGDYTFGVKAQYEHARIISTKLSVEVGKEMKSYWQL